MKIKCVGSCGEFSLGLCDIFIRTLGIGWRHQHGQRKIIFLFENQPTPSY